MKLKLNSSENVYKLKNITLIDNMKINLLKTWNIMKNIIKI